MKCNDCIYEKMCESRYEREHCLSFKDKANFVEVVRCKDCTEWDEESQECSHWYGFRADDYCSYGERREENER